MHFLILLFLFPSLLFCLDKAKAEKLYHEASVEWSRCHEYLQDLNKIDSELEIDQFINVLNLAYASCKKAVDNCNLVLNDLAKKAKKGNKRIWHYDLHEDCKKAKRVFKPELEKITNLLEQSSSRKKITVFIQELAEMTKPAYAKYHEHPHSYQNIDNLISILEEAKSLFQTVLNWIEESVPTINYPVSDLDVKKVRNCQADLQGAIKTIDIHIQDWVKIKESSREDQITLLGLNNETVNLFEEKDLRNYSFENLLKMLVVLEKLYESSNGQEREFVERHLSILRKHFKIEN